MSSSVLITGANRGIGLELAKQFLLKKEPTFLVIATCRKPDEAKDLQALKAAHSNLHVIALEITDFAAFGSIVGKVEAILKDANPGSSSPVGLNLLINNAGILNKEGLQELTEESMVESFRVNTLAPLLFARAFLPLLKRAVASSGLEKDILSSRKACIIQMSTAVASMADNGSGGLYPYRCSKAALNMSMVNLSIDLKSEGILVMAMHPGWVKTEMGGSNALITTEECVVKMISTIDQLSLKDQGKFLRYNNTEIPW